MGGKPKVSVLIATENLAFFKSEKLFLGCSVTHHLTQRTSSNSLKIVRTLDEDYLILSTIHSAKGQEWKSVYCSTP